MILFKKPSASQIKSFLEKTGDENFTYSEIGQSSGQAKVKGYNNDFNRVLLGQGEEVFQKACEAIRNWRMFPGDWAWIEPVHAPVKVDQVVAMVAKVVGIYWVNNCRIVYLLDEASPIRRYGFAYGTLGQHVEQGEELFSVEWLPDGSVWYVLRAYSKPRFWLAKLGYPLARLYQRKFVRESQRAMKREIEKLRN